MKSPRRLGWLLLTLPVAALAADADPSRYFLIKAGDEVIGHIVQRTEPIPDGQRETSEQVITVEAAGIVTRTRTRSETIDDAAGRPRRFSERTLTGSTARTVEAAIGSKLIDFTVTTAADRQTRRLAIDPSTRFDGGAGLLAQWVKAPAERLRFDNVDLDDMTVDVVTIEKIGDGPRPGTIEAIRVRGNGDEDIYGLAKLTIGSDGTIESIVQPMFGMNAVIVPTDRATALKDRAAFKVLDRSMVKAPFRIQKEALAGHIRYRFAFRDRLSVPVPVTGEQRVRREDDGSVRIDVCARCGPGLSTDPGYLDKARAATPWMESDHPRIRAFAAPIGKLAVSDARKMEMLRAKALPVIGTVDFAGHFSALQTMQRRRGDCTESAVLLAALGRAIGIPTKVANGLVYSRSYYHGVSNVFMPHSWTLAFVDGRWQSFDLALDAFDSSHIALTVGDGEPRSIQAASQIAGLLDWKSVEEVRQRPAG